MMPSINITTKEDEHWATTLWLNNITWTGLSLKEAASDRIYWRRLVHDSVTAKLLILVPLILAFSVAELGLLVTQYYLLNIRSPLFSVT